MNDGFPPGFGYKAAKDRPGYVSEQDIRKEKHQKSLNDLQQQIPSAAKGEPLRYDDYGIAQVDPATQLNQAMGNVPPPLPHATSGEQQQQFQSQSDFMGGGQGQPRAPQTQQQQAPQQQAPQAQQAPQPQGMPEQYAQTLAEQAKVNQARQQQIPMAKRSQHPVIKKLLDRFGLKQVKRHNITIFGDENYDDTIYTMSLLPEDLNTWSLTTTQKKLVEIGQEAIGVYFEHLICCASVVAIDNEPIWRIFEIIPEVYEAEQLLEDPFDIPLRIRKVCGELLADLLWSETRPITEKLTDFYREVVLEGKKITSSFDIENEEKVRWVCVRDECSIVEFLKPEEDESGQVKPYFCRTCAAMLVQTTDLKEDRSVPLG
jgi:hypothetical protein